MANTAMVFTGFSLTEMDRMDPDELLEWQERARVRSESNS